MEIHTSLDMLSVNTYLHGGGGHSNDKEGNKKSADEYF